jgi:lysophospholipase L1-like esterase
LRPLRHAAAVAAALACALAARAGDRPAAFRAGDRIVFLGDSVTDGGRQRDGDDPNHAMGQDYAYIIAARLGAQLPGLRLTFVNRGVSADKVTDLKARWQRDAIGQKPDMLSVLIGVNDASSVVDHWPPVVTAEDYERIYDELIRETLAALPRARLVLCEPFALPGGARTREHWPERRADLDRRRAAVERLAARYHAAAVRFQGMFDEACSRAPASYWLWDGIHPTYAGHQLMADEWIRAVTAFYSRPAPASPAG